MTQSWPDAIEYLRDLGLHGFGFANAPITNTAVSGLPPARAGVAGAITSTARQVGSAIGTAIAGGLAAGVTPDHLAQASRPGWLIVAACGLSSSLWCEPPARHCVVAGLCGRAPSAGSIRGLDRGA
jgi:predicted MFS family arabinose efflux permease